MASSSGYLAPGAARSVASTEARTGADRERGWSRLTVEWPPSTKPLETPVSTPELERRVNRLDNDMQAVYELLAAADGKLDALTARVDRLTATQQRHSNRLAEMDSKLDDANARLDTMTATQQHQGAQLSRIIELLEQR